MNRTLVALLLFSLSGCAELRFASEHPDPMFTCDWAIARDGHENMAARLTYSLMRSNWASVFCPRTTDPTALPLDLRKARAAAERP